MQAFFCLGFLVQNCSSFFCHLFYIRQWSGYNSHRSRDLLSYLSITVIITTLTKCCKDLASERYPNTCCPCRVTVYKNVRKYSVSSTSCNINNERSGNRRTARSAANIEAVRNAIEEANEGGTLFKRKRTAFPDETTVNGDFSFSLSCFFDEIFRFSVYANLMSLDDIYSRIINYIILHCSCFMRCDWSIACR